MKLDLKKPGDAQPKSWGKAKTEEPQSQTPRMEREITIKLNPKKILKGFFLITVLFAFFFLGRLSVSSNFMSPSDLTGLTELTGSTPSAAAIVEESILEAEEEVPEEVVEEPVEEEVEEEPKVEAIITEYSKVSLTFTDVGVDWKETWGKISTVTYTLKNDADGTIKPHHFTMMVEGYPVDEPGEFEVPFSSLKVTSLTSIKDSAVVYGYGGKTKGFSYNEKETGNLQEVEIKLFLWDASKNLIAHGKKIFDLSG